jgi:hypothetical protein
MTHQLNTRTQRNLKTKRVPNGGAFPGKGAIHEPSPGAPSRKGMPSGVGYSKAGDDNAQYYPRSPILTGGYSQMAEFGLLGDARAQHFLGNFEHRAKQEAMRVAGERNALEEETRHFKEHQQYLTAMALHTQAEAQRVASERSALEARKASLAALEQRASQEAQMVSQDKHYLAQLWKEVERLQMSRGGEDPVAPPPLPAYPGLNVFGDDPMMLPAEAPLMSILLEDPNGPHILDAFRKGHLPPWNLPPGNAGPSRADFPHGLARAGARETRTKPAEKRKDISDDTLIAGITDEILLRRCTTLMIRNLPNKLTPPMIMECVNELGFDEYDYLFVPIDANAPGWAHRNLGYCFVNFSTPDVAMRFCRKAYGYCFRQSVNSSKASKISIAEEQGVVNNLKRVERTSPRHQTAKPSSKPFIRIHGEMQALPASAALRFLGEDTLA